MILISLVRQFAGVKPQAKAKPADAGGYPYFSASEALKRLEELQASKRNKQPAGSVVTGYVLPTAQAKSPIDGAPVTTPCGRPCRKNEVSYQVGRQLAKGLMTQAEFNAIGMLMSAQFAQLRCLAQDEEGAS